MLYPGIAHQSEITSPLKPNSPRRIVVSSSLLCVAFVPLTALYAAMTQATPPSWTIISKWRP